MSSASPDLRVGQTVTHAELGDGVVVALEAAGYVRVFFRTHGERRVPLPSLERARSWEESIVHGRRPADPASLEQLRLTIEAEELPLLDSAASMTAARVDLLPHQIVLVHRLAGAFPRRFLIADEVGLGKTVETALILRELASRGELTRALMVVPAGLVENWRRELNDTFHLDFEVFGSEGDVTDRKSNAFAKHNRLIASIDTLKRTARTKRLLEAPRWDLVVFDEAHHLSAYKVGRRIRRTENFKLAEALRDHCRDLLLLSATPHQGDHFRFWMLVRLLEPGLFRDEHDMVENRHRLNAVVIRRTKADACAADGGLLFARRVVHAEAFTLGEGEKLFYDSLMAYLRDGYNLAEKQGNEGRALGFVMTIFQKIAASSFAAVRATLRKRLLMLTIHEAVTCDEALDIDGRDRALEDARALIREVARLGTDSVSRAEVERILAESKVQVVRKRQEAERIVASDQGSDDTEIAAAVGEESAAALVSVALPEERRRIRELLARFPSGAERKTGLLLEALGQIWRTNPREKVVVFTTYLGSVDALREAIEGAFPGFGVEVLKGGDHGAKTAAQKRFRREDGPRLLICTAAGREGINLQFARILFNHDLPWNPMDIEQRIGRIHRYGQKDTAQVYNLVAEDTIEGGIYLLLEEKLKQIADTLGKVDEQGHVAEDFRAQILGQLGTRLSYDRLYQEAVRDPSLKRTRQELEVAMSNASLARQVVFELFQDLEGFNLGDYKRVDDQGAGARRLGAFVRRAAKHLGGSVEERPDGLWEVAPPDGPRVLCSVDRDRALTTDVVELLGLEHPLVKKWLEHYRNVPSTHRALWGADPSVAAKGGLLAFWSVLVQAPGGQILQRLVRLGVALDGTRAPELERVAPETLHIAPTPEPALEMQRLCELATSAGPAMLHRELTHAGTLPEGASFSTRLLCLFELAPGVSAEDGAPTATSSRREASARGEVFSVGHSNHPLHDFLALLQAHRIEVLVDTRSHPWSKFSPQYDQEALAAALNKAGMRYVFLGAHLGGRPPGDQYYDEEGHVLYRRVAESPHFLEGIERVLRGLARYHVALMCSEEDPTGCHRRLLVGRVLGQRGVRVRHIRGNGCLIDDDALDPPPHSGALFREMEHDEWRSIRSVSRERRRSSSSGS